RRARRWRRAAEGFCNRKSRVARPAARADADHANPRRSVVQERRRQRIPHRLFRHMTKTGALTITPAPAAPARILVVEDEAITAADLQDRLVQLGYEIAGWAVTGADAVKLARSEQPDLVLMDIRLKGRMTGIEAAREIRAEL